MFYLMWSYLLNTAVYSTDLCCNSTLVLVLYISTNFLIRLQKNKNNMYISYNNFIHQTNINSDGINTLFSQQNSSICDNSQGFNDAVKHGSHYIYSTVYTNVYCLIHHVLTLQAEKQQVLIFVIDMIWPRIKSVFFHILNRCSNVSCIAMGQAKNIAILIH